MTQPSSGSQHFLSTSGSEDIFPVESSLENIESLPEDLSAEEEQQIVDELARIRVQEPSADAAETSEPFEYGDN